MRHTFLLTCCFLALSCARVTVVPYNPKTDAQKDGIRFARPAPYLLVGLDENKNPASQLVYLPDMSEQYRIVVSSGLGSTDAAITLQNGWNLTQFNETRDAQTDEMLTALTGAAGALGVGLHGGLPEGPGLYKLVYDDAGDLTEIRKINVNTAMQPHDGSTAP